MGVRPLHGCVCLRISQSESHFIRLTLLSNGSGFEYWLRDRLFLHWLKANITATRLQICLTRQFSTVSAVETRP
jgi:hypothetical protein